MTIRRISAGNKGSATGSSTKGAGRRMASHSKHANHTPLIKAGAQHKRYEQIRVTTTSIRHSPPVLKSLGRGQDIWLSMKD